jgi:7SK snRNA methylphosphate capping enzyme
MEGGGGRKRGRDELAAEPAGASSSSSSSSSSAASSKRARVERSWGGESAGALAHRYGNYAPPPGRQLPAAGAPADPRLALLDPAWLAGAAVLDVGCGAGLTAIALAERFAVASVLGVDVDTALLRAARRTLAERVRELTAAGGASSSAASSAAAAAPPPIPLSLRLVQRVPAGLAGAAAAAAASSSALPQPPPPHRLSSVVSFRHEDVVADTTLGHPPGCYDAILCFGVTKWVHLNWGDRGVLTLFRRLHGWLRPGGRLLLAAQPWASYRGKARMSQDVAAAYASIKLRPEAFAAFLTARVGFAAVEATLSYRKPSGGERTLLVLRR